MSQESKSVMLTEAQFHTVWTEAAGQPGYENFSFQVLFEKMQSRGLIAPYEEPAKKHSAPVRAILYLLAIPASIVVTLHYLFIKKAYYITGTGLTPTRERVWFKTVFYTGGDFLPIKSIEDKMQAQMGLTSCVVLNFVQIPKRMARYVNQTCELEILP